MYADIEAGMASTRVSSTTYHIYHKREKHLVITPVPNPSKDRLGGPTPRDKREKRAQKKRLQEQKLSRDTWKEEETANCAHISGTATTRAEEEGDDSNDPVHSFFLHTPQLSFHSPPQVLYTSSSPSSDRQEPTKHTPSTPTCLIHSTTFWRSWKLQLGASISEAGVLDPRGVVSWKHNGGDRKRLKNDDTLLKGYKVRNWRLWGESGKEYVRRVKMVRKGICEGVDPDTLPENNNIGPTIVHAEHAIHLHWTSPLSRDTRRYHFHYQGVEFCWKGTSTVRETRRFGTLLRFNHLKLVAILPSIGGSGTWSTLDTDDGSSKTDFDSNDEYLDEKWGGGKNRRDMRVKMECKGKKRARKQSGKKEANCGEVLLATYTSSVAVQKSGSLTIYDEPVARLTQELMPSGRSTETPLYKKMSFGIHEVEKQRHCSEQRLDTPPLESSILYQIIMATALCMIIGERQKRDTIRHIIELLLSEGAGGAGG